MLLEVVVVRSLSLSLEVDEDGSVKVEPPP